MKRLNILLTLTTSFILITSPLMGIGSFNDKEISFAIENELQINTTTPSYLIDVSTFDGIVTLKGSVNNILAKERAAKIARSVKGVRGVINDIDVDTPFLTNKELEKNIKTALINDPATDSWEIKVDAKSGIVTLSGIVDSWQEKQLAAYVTKGTKGVKDVKNNIAIEYKYSRPDVDIKHDIVQMLHNDIRVDDALINVEVTNGKVHLSGTVGSANEKALAIANAWSIGIIEVEADDLKIHDWARNEALYKNKYIVKTNEELKDAVSDAFLFDPRVNSFNPKINVNNGIITLTGQVDNLKAKNAAASDARNIVGVHKVRNYLKVRPMVIPENKDLESTLETAFDMNPIVDIWDINVKANKGVIYLNGTVDSYFEKYKAEDIASKTKGVIAVDNNLKVYNNNDYFFKNYYGWNSYYPPYQINVTALYKSDDQIKEDIESQLWWSPYVNEDQVAVIVNEGNVILKGTVDTRREKLFAEINALEGGAKNVDNQLKVSNDIN